MNKYSNKNEWSTSYSVVFASVVRKMKISQLKVAIHLRFIAVYLTCIHPYVTYYQQQIHYYKEAEQQQEIVTENENIHNL